DYYDWAYRASNADSEKEVIRNEAMLLGTSYAKASFLTTEKSIEYVSNGVVKKSKSRKVYQPELQHINFFNIFCPPDTKDFYKAKWIAYRYISTLGDIKNRYSGLGLSWSDESKIIKGTPLSSYDYSRVYDNRGHATRILEGLCSNKINYEGDEWYNKQIYYIDTKDNQLIEVIEYWEGDRLCILMNGILKYDGISPYPDKPPFMVCTFERQTGTYLGKGLGHKLITLQKEADLVHNGVKDAITMGLYPMFLVPKGSIKDSKGITPNILYWMPSKVLEVVNNIGNAGIETLKLSDLNYVQLGQQHLAFILSQANEIIGVNSYMSGGQAKVERTSTGVTQRVTAMRSRLQPIINSLNRLDSELFQHWLAMATVFMDDEVKVRVVGTDGFDKWSTIVIGDILNKFDIIAENEANRSAIKEIRAAQSLDAVLKLSSINKHPITGMPFYDITPAIQKVVENFNFEALKEFTPDELKRQLELKSEFDILMGQSTQQQVPQDNIKEQSIPIPEATLSGFSGDMFKDIARSGSQI
ncbi:MAG TPA: hypothetical protein PLW93_02440, partial [Candidatus Absconditabacterales bacterium]|nr:hypothetical protein [Candidatus Absconditabacterales bacterium]